MFKVELSLLSGECGVPMQVQRKHGAARGEEGLEALQYKELPHCQVKVGFSTDPLLTSLLLVGKVNLT